MWRFAAALPLTSRIFRRELARRFGARARARFGLRRFARFGLRRFRRRDDIAPRAARIILAACVCCAEPTKPPGGT
jgi:hypothetical protein